MGAELAGFNFNTTILRPRDEVFVQPPRLVGRRSIGEGWAALAGIGVESELRDHQKFASDRTDRTVHLARIISENPYPDNTVDDEIGVALGIAATYAEQDDKPPPNRSDDPTGDPDLGPADPLKNRTHASVVSISASFCKSPDERSRASGQGSIVLKTR